MNRYSTQFASKRCSFRYTILVYSLALLLGLLTLFEKKAKAAEEGFVTEKRNGTTIKYKKKTSYDFEGANIEGLYNKPSGSYISNIKDIRGKSILRMRENFDPEVIDSARHIQ